MLIIKVLGPKSPYTDKLDQYTRAALTILNPHCAYEIVRVTDEADIRSYVKKVPALVVNEQVVSEGAIPAPQLIVSWVSDAMQRTLIESAFAHKEALAPAAR